MPKNENKSVAPLLESTAKACALDETLILVKLVRVITEVREFCLGFWGVVNIMI